jgi:3-deoxy-manno-octulosonate cytidylyltransferase (CMP-KDO synthetase)
MQKKDYLKQVCIYGFNKEELKKFYSRKKKSKLEKIEDIEILRFFEYNIKRKMVKLQSNSIAVDEKADVKKAEELLKKRHQIYK